MRTDTAPLRQFAMGTSGFATEDNKATVSHVVASSGVVAGSVVPPSSSHSAASVSGGVAAAVAANMSVELCLVCGDRASGRHYGAISCEGCKGFFKRSIRKQITYQCRGAMNCEVTKHHRNRCQFCRLQKCLASGMRSDSVQHERKPIVDKKESMGNSSSGSSTSTAAVVTGTGGSGGAGSVGSGVGKSVSPVYQSRSKQPLYGHNLTAAASTSASTSAVAAAAAFSLDNNMAAGVFPTINFADITQALMRASQHQHQQQQQFSSQSQSQSQIPRYSPDLSKMMDDEDDDSMDNSSTLCLQNLSSVVSNNNTQNINFNMDALPTPATAVGLIQTSLDKRVIDKALQLLAPIQQQLERMAIGSGGSGSASSGGGSGAVGGNDLNIKNEIDDDEMNDGIAVADEMDHMLYLYGPVSSNFQDEFILNDCIFDTDLLTGGQIAFNLQEPALVSSYLNVHYVCETGSRIIFLSVYWLRKVTAFKMLNERSQIKLLRAAWPGLVAIALAQSRNLSVATIISTLINNIRQLAEIEKIEPHKIRKLSEQTSRLYAFVQEMLSHDVTDTEYALLRLAIVFNPQVLVRRKERAIRSYVQRVQLYAVSSLRQHITGTAATASGKIPTSSNGPATVSEERFHALIMNIVPLSALESDVIEELFFASLVGQLQIDNMIPYILTLSANNA